MGGELGGSNRFRPQRSKGGPRGLAPRFRPWRTKGQGITLDF